MKINPSLDPVLTNQNQNWWSLCTKLSTRSKRDFQWMVRGFKLRPKTHNRSLQIWSQLFLCLHFSSHKHAVPGYFCPYQSQLTADSQPEVFIVYYNDCLKVVMIEGLSIMPHDFRNFESWFQHWHLHWWFLFYFSYYYNYYYHFQFCDVAKRWWSSNRQFSKICVLITHEMKKMNILTCLWLPTLIIYWNLVIFWNIHWICNRKFPKFGWWKSQVFLLLLLDIMNIFPKIWGPPSSRSTFTKLDIAIRDNNKKNEGVVCRC